MGADFSNRWLFFGDADATTTCDVLLRCLQELLKQSGHLEVASEEDADRSFVVRSTGRWVFIGDTAGTADCASPEEYDAVSRAISKLGPLVDVEMSDSAAVHFHLHRDGTLLDKFGNAAFPFFRFKTAEEAAPYRGRPELWTDLLVSPDDVERLRSTWVQEWKAEEILANMGRLMGWEPGLLWVGYTHDSDGIPIKYDEFLRCTGITLSGFRECHFKRGDGHAPRNG
jgi:hypothetical protein